MRGLTVNLFARNRLQGQLLVSLDLETKGEHAETIQHLTPRLQDAYNTHLLRFGQTILDPRRPLDVRRLEQALQYSTDNILGPGTARVLIHSAMISQR